MKTFIKRALATAALVAGSLTAHAAVIYTFDLTGPVAFGTGPFGTVTLTDTGSGIDFSVSLRSDLNFVNTGNHSVFTFNANDVAAADISNVLFNGSPNVNYTVVSPGENPPFGSTFTLAIDCTGGGCSNGAPGQISDPLTFSVANAEYTDFGFNVTGTTAFFAADVICSGGTCEGVTGAIGVSSNSSTTSNSSNTSTTSFSSGTVPEPNSGALVLIAVGLLGASLMSRRKA